MYVTVAVLGEGRIRHASNKNSMEWGAVIHLTVTLHCRGWREGGRGVGMYI